MAELWYRLRQLPDLTLNKYASLEGNGVDGVLEKHIAFLRQLNRKGIVSNLSYHLLYFYLVPDDKSKDTPGHRLQIYLMIHGSADALENVPALIRASPLEDFYKLDFKLKKTTTGDDTCSIDNILSNSEITSPIFNTCAFLSKTETLLSAGNGEGEDYYMLREWEMNEDGRLYNMCKMMEALNRTTLYRVDLYPVEKSVSLRESLRKPMSILRKRQDERGSSSRKDYDGKDVLDSYEELIEKYDSSPHFITNVMVFANGKEDAISILDSAGSESLMKGKYNISTFTSNFDVHSFIEGDFDGLENIREGMVVRKGKQGLIVCREDTASINLNYLPTLFSLEEVAPFFRFPALYDGETIQIAKETAPASIGREGSLFLGKDRNGYDVFLPLSLLPKHAFVSGVPGSGKTNTMHHITSSLWKDHRIPFLVLEPAKQEYRALANDPEMKDMYLFSPNADMSFPLHINPFEMPKGTLVAEHIRRLCSVFEGAFPLEPPMPFLLDTAIEAVYRELGWIPEHVYMGDEKLDDGVTKRRLPTMSMLYRRLEQELKSTQYSDEVRGNLESALKVRIGSLLRREMGDVFDVPESSFTPEKWLEVPAVIELESMGTGPANFLTLMLCALIRETLKVDPKRESSSVKSCQEGDKFAITIDTDLNTKEVFVFDMGEIYTLKVNDVISIKSESGMATLNVIGGDDCQFVLELGTEKRCGYYSLNKNNNSITLYWGNRDVRHVIFIEEAHNLIGPESEEQTGAEADPKQAATAFVVKMLAEVRALKEGIVIADQLPTVMAQEVLKNTGLKIGLRITSADDRSLLGSTMAASALQLERMSTFAVGEALIFYEKLMRPFEMRIKEWCGEIENQNEKETMVTPKNDADLRSILLDRESYPYRNANAISYEIILDKYHQKIVEIDKKIVEEENQLFEIVRTLKDFNIFFDYLWKVALGEIKISAEKINEQYDRLNKWVKQLKDMFDKYGDAFDAPVEIIGEIYELVSNIDRLKKGRWKRSGLESEVLEDASILQRELNRKANQVSNIYMTLKKEIIPIGQAKASDIRVELKNSIKKTRFIENINKTVTLLENIASLAE